MRDSLRMANVLRLNDEELPALVEWFGLGGTAEEQAAQLAERFDLRMVALTSGSAGALLLRGSERSRAIPPPVEVVDTVGAGDTFTAAMVLGLLRGLDLQEINERANRAAAYVCSQAGATPGFPDRLRIGA